MKKVLIISGYTIKDHLKSKVMYVTLFLALSIVLVTFVATEFTYGVPEKVAIDFGLGLLSLSSLAISIFMGSSLLSKEIESRTVYMVISRPVSRAEFISGKLLGLILIQGLNFLILSVTTISMTLLFGGSLNQLIFQALFFCFLESLLALLLVVFFSLGCNIFISTSITVLMIIIGHGIQETNNLSFVLNRPYLKWFLDQYHFVFPAFYKLNLKDFVIYNQSIDFSIILSNSLYGIFYCLTIFLGIIFIFNKKNID